MRLWPFGNTETRQTTDFSDAVVQALLSQAGGDEVSDATALAAIEACAGLWGRAFASADVSPESVITDALTPSVLEIMGRQLLIHGEAVFEIITSRGMPTLRPCSSWTLTGDDDPRSWEYETTTAGPGVTTTKHLTAARVIHVRYGVTPEEPWRGIGPLEQITVSKKLAARLETQLSNDANTAHGYVIPVPKVDDALQSDIKGLKGKGTLVESTASGWEEGRQKAPQNDYQVQRIGSNPPAVLETLRESVARHIFAASGVHPAALGISDGVSMREGFRQFLHGTIKPVAKLLYEELRGKLDVPDLALSFDELGASDITGRARAFQGLVNGGMTIEKAAALSGLMVNDDA